MITKNYTQGCSYCTLSSGCPCYNANFHDPHLSYLLLRYLYVSYVCFSPSRYSRCWTSNVWRLLCHCPWLFSYYHWGNACSCQDSGNKSPSDSRYPYQCYGAALPHVSPCLRSVPHWRLSHRGDHCIPGICLALWSVRWQRCHDSPFQRTHCIRT